MMRSIYTVLMTVLLLLAYIPAAAQAPTPTPEEKPLWVYLRTQKNFDSEDILAHFASLKVVNGETQSKSVYQTGQFKGYYQITDWGVDCKRFALRELRTAIFDTNDTQVFAEPTFGPWLNPEKGISEETHSLGYIALRDFWCEQ